MNNFTINIGNSGSLPQQNKSVSNTIESNKTYHTFEQQYLALRNKENRIYTDEELINLPNIGKSHPHYKEWLVRKNTFQKLKSYLNDRKKSLDVLEVGCGNGWLSNQLSLHANCRVTGLDINGAEIDQAQRVFRNNTECNFIYGDIQSEKLAQKKFDIIMFAASLQYFSSSKEILKSSLKMLKPGGEIHIVDTHFYKPTEVEEARQRSKSHFTSLGFPGMSDMYFHHSLNELNDLHPTILYNPFSFTNRFFKSKAPFYWLSIMKR